MSAETAAQKIARLEGVILAIGTAKHVSLGDLVYAVREREGLGWDGPAVKAWGDAVAALNAEIRRIQAG